MLPDRREPPPTRLPRSWASTPTMSLRSPGLLRFPWAYWWRVRKPPWNSSRLRSKMGWCRRKTKHSFSVSRRELWRINSRFRRETDENRLVKALLPSLTSFSCLVDLRPSFGGNGQEIKFSVPVVLAHIANDSTDDAWIQMSKSQVERLILDLQDVLRKISVLENWASMREESR